MSVRKLTIVAFAAALAGTACGADTEATAPAWPQHADTDAVTPAPVNFAEVSDLLPTVERQIGQNGRREPFMSSRLVLARGQITSVEGWYSISIEMSPDGADTGRRSKVPFGTAEIGWHVAKASIAIDHDFQDADLNTPEVTAMIRFDTVHASDEFDSYVDKDVVVWLQDGQPFTGVTPAAPASEWALTGVFPITSDGVISWPELWSEWDVIGRATTIGELERIGTAGEIVVTKDASNPPVVIERRPKKK